MTTKSKTETQIQTTNNLTNEQSTLKFRHGYSPRHRSQIHFKGQGITKQEFKEECDINNIMALYNKTGQISHVSHQLPQYVDLDGQDFYEAMQIVAEGKTIFEQLPSSVRTKFENDPGKFLDFVHNPENLPEMAEMGLLRPDYQPKGGTIDQQTTIQPNQFSTNVEEKSA